MTCLPFHIFEPGPGWSPEDAERAEEEHKRRNRPDPRAIRRQHRFPINQHPHDDDATPDSGWVYLKIEPVTKTPPDDRPLLKGGPESGLPCQCSKHPHCDEMTRITAETSFWDIVSREESGIVGLDKLSEEKANELMNRKILILTCPKCECSAQMLSDCVPRKVHAF